MYVILPFSLYQIAPQEFPLLGVYKETGHFFKSSEIADRISLFWGVYKETGDVLNRFPEKSVIGSRPFPSSPSPFCALVLW